MRHPRHRDLVALVQQQSERGRRRRGGAGGPAVPTAVRVESGWRRQDPRAAPLQRLRVRDVPLDGEHADRGAGLRRELGVSVADAHLGAALTSTPGPHAVATSDPDDVRAVADRVGVPVRVLDV